MNKFITKSVFASALAALALTSGVKAGETTTAVVEPPPAPAPHVLIAVNFANEYVTPRGMVVRNDGLTIQPLLLTFLPLYKSDDFSLTLVAGMWNDLGTYKLPKSSTKNAKGVYTKKTAWSEIDPIVGLSAGLGKYFTLDVTYTAFVEQIYDIGTSNHLETKLSFKDSDFLGAFALNPYASFWLELDGKATAANIGPVTYDSSWYFDLGVSPSYTFKDFGAVTISAPCRVLLPSEDFYGQNSSKSTSTIGLWEVGAKISAPLTFVPKTYGSWSGNVGVKYMEFVDDNLKAMNKYNAPSAPDQGTTQVYGGVSVFF